METVRESVPEGLRIRSGGPDDVPRLVALLVGGALLESEDAEDFGPYRRAMQEIVSTAGNEVIVAEANGRVIGMCQLIIFRHIQNQGGLCAEVESMYVDDRFRSQGVGSRLLDEAVARARRADCYRVQLTSNKVRALAHEFYRRNAFVATHEGFKRDLY